MSLLRRGSGIHAVSPDGGLVPLVTPAAQERTSTAGKGPGPATSAPEINGMAAYGVPARDAQACDGSDVWCPRDTQLTGTFFYDRGTVLGRLA